MNKGWWLLTVLLALAACRPDAPPTPPQAVAAADVLIWQGHYRGQLPCADCNRIELDITLYPDLRYRMSTLKVGHFQKPPLIVSGRFFWREDGLIQLDQAGDNMVFFIGRDGALEMRGNDGKAYPNSKGEICHLQKRDAAPLSK